MAELQVSVQGSPARCAARRQEGAALRAGPGRALPALLLREAERRGPAPPPDSLRVFCTEGGGSSAGSLSSLSSLSSAGPGGGSACEDMQQWGPKFDKLRELYSHREAAGL